MRRQTLRLGLAAIVAVALLGGAALATASADDRSGQADGLEWMDAHEWMADTVADHQHGDHHDEHHDEHQHGDHHDGEHQHGDHHDGEHQHDEHHDGEHAPGACH